MKPFTRPIITRGYELDSSMTVPLSMLLRYFEHLRWESIQQPGLGLGSLFQDGFRMVVRAQQLLVHELAGFEQSLEVSLALGYVGRASLDMHHEVRRSNDGKLLAQGVVTAVYLNPSGHPQAVPDFLRSLVSTTQRTTLLAAPTQDMPSNAWVRNLVVVPSDVDLYQHVNHARYLDLFHDTRWLAVAAGGYGDATDSANRCIRCVSIDYQRQAVAGDEIRVATWMDDEGYVDFEMQRAKDGQVLARCRFSLYS